MADCSPDVRMALRQGHRAAAAPQVDTHGDEARYARGRRLSHHLRRVPELFEVEVGIDEREWPDPGARRHFASQDADACVKGPGPSSSRIFRCAPPRSTLSFASASGPPLARLTRIARRAPVPGHYGYE